MRSRVAFWLTVVLIALPLSTSAASAPPEAFLRWLADQGPADLEFSRWQPFEIPPETATGHKCAASANCQGAGTASCTGSGNCNAVDRNCAFGQTGYAQCDSTFVYCDPCGSACVEGSYCNFDWECDGPTWGVCWQKRCSCL